MIPDAKNEAINADKNMLHMPSNDSAIRAVLVMLFVTGRICNVEGRLDVSLAAIGH